MTGFVNKEKRLTKVKFGTYIVFIFFAFFGMIEIF